MIQTGSELILTEAGENCFAVLLPGGNGTAQRLPAITPAEALIAASEIDYSDYRREVQRLWNEHPLFEERLDIPVADLEDFMAEALLLPFMLCERDPVSFFVLGRLLHNSLQAEDDGTATFLLTAGYQILRVLQEPLWVQARLRNIFEVTFDGMERAGRREQFEKLQTVYPDIARLCDPALLNNSPEGSRTFAVHSLFGLRLLELALYFHQDQQRIARCEYCGGYFIPKTKKLTRYCDRVIDGFSCKKRGARFMRNEDRARDEALLICKKLRDRMYARLLRYQEAASGDRKNLLPMDYDQYDAWSENARLARMDYLAGKLSAEAFLRKIDTNHDLTCYEAGRAELTEETPWQRMVAGDVDFDPATHYPDSFMLLDLRAEHPNWKTFSADDLRRLDQEGRQSLREKYGKG